MPERRAFPRWRVSLDCEAEGEAGTCPGVIQTLCEDGLSFCGHRVWVVGEQISLRWRFEPNGTPFFVQGIVRNSTPDHTGVEFLNLAMHDRLHIMHLLTSQNAPS